MAATLNKDKFGAKIIGEETICSDRPEFFFDALQATSPYLVRSAQLDLRASELPVPPTLEKLPGTETRQYGHSILVNSFRDAGVDIEQYAKQGIEKGLLPFASIELGYDGRN